MNKPPLLSIRRTIPVLIVAPLLITVVFAGLLSYINSRRSVKELAEKISANASLAIKENLKSQLETPQVQVQTTTAQFYDQDTIEEEGRLPRYLWSLFQQQGISTKDAYVFFTNHEGEFVGLRAQNSQFELRVLTEESQPQLEHFGLDSRGEITTRLQTSEYYPHQRAWYEAGSKLPANRSGWSPVYIYTSGELGLTAVQAAYEGSEYLGVFGIDLSLATIQEFLKGIDISEEAETFVIERSGNIIATSTDNKLSQTVGNTQQPLNILDIDHPRLQTIAKELYENYNQDWTQVKTAEHLTKRIGGQTEFLTISPFTDRNGLDWLVVVTIPESDFQSTILRNTQSTALVGSTIALLGTFVGLMVARWIIRPIDNLNNAAKAIEDQRFQPMTLDQTAQRQDELGQLATVFQRMGTVISTNQASLEEQKEALEAEVAQAKRQQQGSRKHTLETVRSLLRRSRYSRQQSAQANIRANAQANVNLVKSASGAANRYRGQSEGGQPVELTVEELLYQVSYFAHFTPVDIQQLLAAGQVIELPAQTLVFAEDEPGDSFYVVLTGAVDIVVERLQKFLTHIEAGGFFGELSLLLGLPRTATVRTTEPTTVFCLDHAHLRTLIEQDPPFAERIAVAVEAHQEELTARQVLLVKQGLINNPEQLQQNPLTWIRQRIHQLFGGPPPLDP